MNFANNTDKFGVLEVIDIENTMINENIVNMISTRTVHDKST